MSKFFEPAIPEDFSQCVLCTHKREEGCDAFPDGIPEDILDNTADHTKPYPNDHDIQFEALS